jgi:hypothetical protein
MRKTKPWQQEKIYTLKFNKLISMKLRSNKAFFHMWRNIFRPVSIPFKEGVFLIAKYAHLTGHWRRCFLS